MDNEDLAALLAKHEVKIDGWHGGAGQFRDLEIGVGASLATLRKLVKAFAVERVVATVEVVNVADHKDVGKPYLLVRSFWWNEK